MNNNLKIENTSLRPGKVWWSTTIVIVIISLILVMIGYHTKQSKESKESIFEPNEYNSVISKTNNLLSHVLENEDRTIRIRSINDLNKKYPGLVFDAPDINVDADFIRTTDIRLVDVKLKFIKNRKDRDFYNNGNLADLLEKQRMNMGLSFFRIKMNKDSEGYYIISSIEVVPSVFRYRLDNKVSRSTILSNPNNMFPSTNYCFLIWKDQIIPIKKQNEGDIIVERAFSANERSKFFYRDFSDSPISLINIDSIYRVQEGNNRVRIDWEGNGYLLIEYLQNGHVSLKTGNRLICDAYENGKIPIHIEPQTSSDNPTLFDFDNDIRLVFGQGNSREEIIISHVNPLTTLASATRSAAGVSRYTISSNLTDKYTQQVVSGLESLLAHYDYNDTVRLTIDPIFAKYFERELMVYTKQLMNQSRFAKGSWEVSMTVMDMATGDIIAMPYFRSEDEHHGLDIAFTRKNPAFIRRYPGSTFKPMIALASVLTCPSLLSLDTRGHYSLLDNYTQARFYGSLTEAWAKKTPNHWNGRDGMINFLAFSCDVYPVALAALALNRGNRIIAEERNGFFKARNGQIFMDNDRTLAEQDLMKNLDILYDLNSDSEEHDSAARMIYYIWRNLTSDTVHFSDDNLLALDLLSPDPVIMHYSKIAREPFRQAFVPWVLGQGTNEWNSVKMAEAWCRMLTKRDVKASMVMSAGNTEPPHLITDRLTDNANINWNTFLEQFRRAQHVPGGTVYPMQGVVDSLNRYDSHLHDDTLLLFSKTGTPNNYERKEFNNLNQEEMVLDVGMYTFGIMKNSEYQNVVNSRPAKGIVCVLRFTRIVKKRDAGDNDGLSSTDARNFFSKHSYHFANFYHLIEHYL